MLSLLNERKSAVILLLCCLLFFVVLILTSAASYDNGDGMNHYLVARFSWKHPELFLNSWAKPFFTLVASPFAQFGIKGISVFNVLCGVASAWFTFIIAQQLKFKYPVLVIVFLLFMPVYFPILNSGLTEAFFGLVLIASIFLVIKQKYIFAAVLVSFLPYVRSEGFLVLPLFGLLLLYRRQYVCVLMLMAGTIVYSVVGYFYYGDILWISNQNPYNGENRAFYGSGEITHFITNYDVLFGIALTLLLLIGITVYPWKILAKRAGHNLVMEESILIFGSFAVYFVAHSVMWWQGLANSLGLLRVIAGVAPCAALICSRGLDMMLIPWFDNKRIVTYSLIIILPAFVMITPFCQEYFPFRLNPQEEMVKETADWYKSSGFAGKKVYYQHPYFTHVLDIDPYDPARAGQLAGLYPMMRDYGEHNVTDSSIVFWDAHFGPNECQVPLDSMLRDPKFLLVKSFRPTEEFTSLGDYEFEIHAFMKVTR